MGVIRGQRPFRFEMSLPAPISTQPLGGWKEKIRLTDGGAPFIGLSRPKATVPSIDAAGVSNYADVTSCQSSVIRILMHSTGPLTRPLDGVSVKNRPHGFDLVAANWSLVNYLLAIQCDVTQPPTLPVALSEFISWFPGDPIHTGSRDSCFGFSLAETNCGR